jgi:hypothetical protein
MKKKTFGLLLAGTLLITYPLSQATAGPGHDGHSHSHDITADDAKSRAKRIINKLVEKKKIKASWKQSDVKHIEKKRFGKKDEWVVSFNNMNEGDTSKQTLYIFLSMEGRYIAANFTGK